MRRGDSVMESLALARALLLRAGSGGASRALFCAGWLNCCSVARSSASKLASGPLSWLDCGVLDGFLGGAAVVAKIEQRRNHVGLQRRAAAAAPRSGSGASMAASLSRSSTTMRSAVLRPTPGMRVRRTQIARANRRNQFLHAHARENLQRQHRPDARGGKQQLEKLLLARGQESRTERWNPRAGACG